jgi:Protein of unknown function (DUF499)
VSAVTPWWETQRIRPEILSSSGQIDDVQMSLYKAVYGQGGDRPAYADAGYYGEITHPSPPFIHLIANVAVRLGGGANYTAAPALWRLDQAMGGGKSHGLIGLYHLAASPEAFRRTDVGAAAHAEAEQMVGGTVPADLNHPQVVVLACDNMTAGKSVYDDDGPATTLHERFLWRLFSGDRALYDRYQPDNANKSKLVDAVKAVNRPVLILIDEIMDYIRQLSASDLHDLAVGDMAFLRALFDAVNDVPHVAMVVVMIASEKDSMDLDAEGQSRRAELDVLLVRNGTLATINDNTDFAAILRRRLFDSDPPAEVLATTANAFARTLTGPWKTKVFDALGATDQRWLREWDAELARCYPFHPHLITLAEQEWAKLSGFQRVRSTIRIFAAAVYSLSRRAEQGEWAPLLIGPGDLPLSEASVREAVLGSGLIADARTQVNYRSLVSADIVDGDDQTGSARLLDRERTGALFQTVNPRAAERAATCVFLCSIVGSRGGGRQGASELEVKAATFVPDAAYGLGDADSVLAELKDIDAGGLASVELIAGKGGQPPRLFMSTRQTLNMLFRAARVAISDDDRDAEVALTAERLLSTGPFKTKLFVAADLKRTPLEVLETAGIDDARSTRLVALDPQQFSLLNGIDQDTRAGVRAAMGIGSRKMPVQWASSAVYAIANTQRRAVARGAAVTFLAWERVSDMPEVRADGELGERATAERAEARRNLDTAVKRAYQHVCYLDLGDETDTDPRVDRTITFEQENQSALDGTIVWKALAEAGKAFEVGALTGKVLLHTLRDDDYDRPLDEVRDRFWNSPRMPLLPGGDSDLQRAIYDAVTTELLRLNGADGSDRHVTGANEIGVGQTSLRLAKPSDEPPTGNGEGDDQDEDADDGSGMDGGHGKGKETDAVTERQVAFALRSTVSGDSRDALYALLQELADRVDAGEVSYAELMVKMRASENATQGISRLVSETGTVPDVRDV